jgi:hypothetical protein
MAFGNVPNAGAPTYGERPVHFWQGIQKLTFESEKHLGRECGSAVDLTDV